ncbi:PucR family transcriptional regulator [Streptomyces sp. SID6648]|nr:PucR family transcriptional regulator [Streptomyces sp. SID6648]
MSVGEFRVADVVREASLQLSVVAGRGGLDRRVRSAHVSELPDPTDWLRGGELLMTTGMSVEAAGGPDAYMRALGDAGVAAVALGLGSTLTYQRTPRDWVSAADRLDLPLIEVPARTPFIAVTDVVYRRLTAMRNEDAEQTIRAQQVLAGLALRPGGVAAVAGGLATEAGLRVVVTDLRGTVLAAAPEGAEAIRDDVAGELARVGDGGMRASARCTGAHGDVMVQPLGADQLRGLLVCADPSGLGVHQRMLIGSAVALLSAELEHVHARQEAERSRRSAAVLELVTGTHDRAAASALLSSIGLPEDALRVAVVPGGALELADGLPAGAAARVESDLVLLLPGPEGLAEMMPGRVVGLSGPVRQDTLPLGLRQARVALWLARRNGPGVYDADDRPSLQLLLHLGPPEVLRAYADGVFGAIDALPQTRREELMRTLWTWMGMDCSYGRTAAQLGIHRHTLRERLQKVEELTGRRLASWELGAVWVALMAREAADSLDAR